MQGTRTLHKDKRGGTVKWPCGCKYVVRGLSGRYYLCENDRCGAPTRDGLSVLFPKQPEPA